MFSFFRFFYYLTIGITESRKINSMMRSDISKTHHGIDFYQFRDDRKEDLTLEIFITNISPSIMQEQYE